MHKNWNAIVEFSVRKKFLLLKKNIVMQKVFFVLVSGLDGFFQKFCVVRPKYHQMYPNPFICLKWFMFWIGYKEHSMVCF